MNPKDRKTQVDALIRKMEDGIRGIFSSEQYAQYLKTMSRFHRYSFRNQLLIHLQNPQATFCAGYVAWQNKFERHVKKGETGIRILVPYRHKYRRTDPDTAEDTPEIKETAEEREYITFHVGNVFDVSQTEGKPIPTIVHDLHGNVEEYEHFIEAVKQICPVPITRKELPPSLDGYFSPGEKRIVLRDGMSQVQEAAAVIHEMAHAVLHNPEELKSEEAKRDKQTIEVEAESVSNVVCSYFDIDTKENSWGYIATWSKTRDLPELTASIKTIRDTADRFITGIEERMQALRKERSGTVEISGEKGGVDKKETLYDALLTTGSPQKTGEDLEPSRRL